MANAHELERMAVKLVGDSSHLTNTLKSAQTQVMQTAKVMNTANGEMAVRFNSAGRAIDQYGKYVASADADTKAFTGTITNAGFALNQIGAGISRVGRKMTLFITGPLTVFAALSLSSFSDFDAAMTQSTAIMSGVNEELRQELEETANTLASVSTTAPKELAESYFFLASAGYDAVESMQALSKVNNFAIAGMFDMAQATDLLTDAQSALGLNAGTLEQKMAGMARVSDTLVRANTLANASVEQFSIALTSKAGASLKVFNKDVEEGVAVLAAFADQGVKAQLAGNQLDRIIRLLSKASMDNAAAHEAAGFKVFDTAGKMRNLGDIVGNLEDNLKGLSDAEKVATLATLGFEARVQQAILPLIGTSKAIKEYEAELRKAKGLTEEIAEKQMKSFAGQMQIVKNQIDIVAQEIGSILAPLLLAMNEHIKVAIEWWNNLSLSTKRWVVGIAAAVAAIGPLLMILGAFISAIGAAIAFVGAFLLIGWEIVAVAAAIVVAVGLLVAGLVAMGAAVVALIVWLVGTDSLVAAWKSVTIWAEKAITTIIGFVANLTTNIKIFIDWFGRNWENVLSDALQLMVLFAGNMLQNMVVVISTIIKLWWGARESLQDVWKQVFTVDFVNWAGKGTTKAGSIFVKFAEGAYKSVQSIFKRKGKAVTMADFATKIETGAASVDMDFITKSKGIMQKGLSELRGPFEGFVSSIEEAPEFVYTLTRQVGKAGAEGVADAWNEEMDRLDAEAMIKGPSEAMVLLVSDIDKLNEKMTAQGNTFGMTAREADIFKLSLRGATSEQLRSSRILDAALTKMEKQKKLIDEGKSLTEKLLTPQEKYTASLKKYDEMLNAEAISQETFNRATKEAQDLLKKETKLKFSVTGIQAVEAGTAEAMARLEAFRNVKTAGGIAFDDAAKVEAREAVGKVTVGADTSRTTMNEYLRQIAENTATDADRPVVVLQGANL